MRNSTHLSRYVSKPFLFAFAMTLGIFGATAALAWTGPAASAPGSNASAPLNTSATGQVKEGGLQLNTGGAATGLIVGGSAVVNGASALSTNTKLSVSGGNIQVYNPSSSYNTNTPGMQMGTYSGYGFIQAPSGGSVHIWDSGTNNIATFSPGYLALTGTIDATGPASNWAGIFRPGGGAYGLAVTANSSGCYSYLSYSSYGAYTNCSTYTAGNVYASDVYVSAAGAWMSTLANNNPRNGGMYWYGGYTYIPNPATGGYGCPSGFSAYGPYTPDMSDGHFGYAYICR